MMVMLSRDDLFRAVPGLSETFLDTCLAQGWVHPSRSGAEDVFLEIDAARLRLILELMRDFAVTEETMPLVLGLLDQIHDLKRTVARLENTPGDSVTKRARKQIPVKPKTPSPGL